MIKIGALTTLLFFGSLCLASSHSCPLVHGVSKGLKKSPAAAAHVVKHEAKDVYRGGKYMVVGVHKAIRHEAYDLHIVR